MPRILCDIGERTVADPLLHSVKIVPAISDGGEANLATAAAIMGRPG